MAITVRENSFSYNPPPEALHQAVLADVIDMGLVKTQYGEKHKVKLVFQLEAVDPIKKEPFLASKSYTASLNEKAALRKDLEAWRGKKLTTEELQGFDLERLIGINCQIQIVHEMGQDNKTYARITAIVPLGKNTPPIKVLGYVRRKDRDTAKAKEQAGGQAPPPGDDDVPF